MTNTATIDALAEFTRNKRKTAALDAIDRCNVTPREFYTGALIRVRKMNPAACKPAAVAKRWADATGGSEPVGSIEWCAAVMMVEELLEEVARNRGIKRAMRR